ncbi:alpha/beta-hydrolase [Dichomitus squalens LYAD-421 SS1]|uniref:Alpha/beta-hydrolase n=1 Tax=Dichomitus squalens (strain LYAD-421) TaxID=732165 RepID=R7SY36_DICSQ|nr:alpha/beta-hydrolase [Dichomitus squalens LYAD-421 SS1]EJF61006.1 alpha/beta-hydrolase [Dichomitus squalens LYAD-421 SS1]
MALAADSPSPSPASSPKPRSLLEKLHRVAFFSSALYAVFIVLLATPFFQRHAIYQHALRYPWGAKFHLPEKYGLAPGKTMNFQLTTPDNVTLGSWFVLSEPFYQAHRMSSPVPVTQPTMEVVRDAIRAYPTILYCHGASATRAAPTRVQHYASFTSRLRANVLVFDYRGFGESEGEPSDWGLREDARTAWRWLIDQGARPEDVLILGHSLGTGVATTLATWLAQQDVRPRGVVLTAPFTNVATLVQTYDIQGVPILQPLQTFPLGRKLLQRLVQHEFDTLSTIKDINVPVLLAHSQDDMEIPVHHSRTLLDKLLDPHLPMALSLPPNPDVTYTKEEYTEFLENQKLRNARRSELVRRVEIPSFGTVEEFDGTAGKVVYVETFWGAHNMVGLQEGVQDVIASTFRLGSHL